MKRSRNKRWLVGAGILSLGLVAGACASGTDAKVDSATKAPAKHEAPATTEAPTTEAPTTAPPTTEAPKPKPPPENPELTNAKRSAQSYVDMSGFSRQGLIDQLSSEYGEKFPVAIATAAVDSLTVDWNQEAVESAKSYVEMSGDGPRPAAGSAKRAPSVRLVASSRALTGTLEAWPPRP